jgi:hypothetical protein
MTEPGFERLREAGAEFALGVLPGRDRARAVAHLHGCPACEQHVRELTALSDRILGLVPGAEPPVGFEQRVMDRLGLSTGRRRRRRLLVAAAAVLLTIAVGALGWIARDVFHHEVVSAPIEAGGQLVGEAFAYTETRSWIYVELSTLSTTGPVDCQVRLRDGRVLMVGTFPVVGGAAQWGGPAPLAEADLEEIRIFAPDGSLIGTAHFD